MLWYQWFVVAKNTPSLIYIDSIWTLRSQEPPQDKLELSNDNKALKSCTPTVGSKSVHLALKELPIETPWQIVAKTLTSLNKLSSTKIKVCDCMETKHHSGWHWCNDKQRLSKVLNREGTERMYMFITGDRNNDQGLAVVYPWSSFSCIAQNRFVCSFLK